MKSKTAIIVGSGGQDGQLLSKQLVALNYSVIGVTRNTLDILNSESVKKLISKHQPTEVYFFAAYHHSSEDEPVSDLELFEKSFDIHVHALINFLGAIADYSPQSRLFYASSSLIFGSSCYEIQSEDTEYNPEIPYAISKVAGMEACRYFREKKGIFASVGILYNHESPLRNPKFVTRKIVQAAVRIHRQGSGDLQLGNLNSIVDWGYAPDFVAAMHQMLQMSVPKDFIIATGEAHTVREFVEIAFTHVGLNYLDYVIEKAETLSRTNRSRIGDSTRLKQELGWRPSISFEKMVKLMVDAELNSFA